MTIYRSSSFLAAALLMGAVQASAQGQDSLQVAELPEVHVVAEGETLWGLAIHYFGDPYMWPEIYRVNTLVVEDPHWIFPGEELRFGERPVEDEVAILVPVDSADIAGQAVGGEIPVQLDSVAVELQGGEIVAQQPPVFEESTLFRPSEQVRGGITIGGSGVDFYRAVRGTEFYSSGFLTEDDELPWGDVINAVGARSTSRISTASSATVFELIEIEAPESALYQVGDSLLIASVTREISDWGEVVVPTGVARVNSVAGRSAIAEVLTQFGLVLSGQRILPLEVFSDPGSVRPVPVEGGVRARVIQVRDRHPVPNQQNIVFIDVGRSDGVVPGDVFEITRAIADISLPDAPVERVAILRIVHVRENSASGMLMQIYRTGVVPRAPARLIRKMPT